jgi:hypothetical protein
MRPSLFNGELFDADHACRYGNESYTTLVTRREAVYVLDNPELLMMHAQARNDVCGRPFSYFYCYCILHLSLDMVHLKYQAIFLFVLPSLGRFGTTALVYEV